MNQNPLTKERILTAARKVFIEKSYEATKTRDIASEAGVNIASLHYYFKSKERLFRIIVTEIILEYTTLINKELEGNKPLHLKIRHFINVFFDFLEANPAASSFLLNEFNRNPQRGFNIFSSYYAISTLDKQLKDLATKRIIRPTTINHFLSDILGLSVFPYLCKSAWKSKMKLNENDFRIMIEDRKKRVADMVISYLYYNPPK